MKHNRVPLVPSLFIIFALVAVFVLPVSPVHAALTEPQVQSILNLLTSFSVDSATITNVNTILHGGTPSSAPTSGGLFTSDFGLGARSEQVRQLQLILISKNLLPAESATGFFGPLTAAAVKALQTANGLAPVGTVGPKTRAYLNGLSGGSTPVTPAPTSVPSVSTFVHTLASGSSGADVTALQQVLKSQGYLAVEPTGFYGPATIQAVSAFQKATGLEVVGAVGPQTLLKLNDLLHSVGGGSGGTTSPPTTSTSPAPKIAIPSPSGGDNGSGGGGGGGGSSGGGGGGGGVNTTPSSGGTSGGGSTTLPPAPSVSLSANPTSIVVGQSSTLTWSSTEATSCTGSGFTISGTSGSATVSPTATTTYTMTCSGAGGSTSVSTNIPVAAISAAPAAPTLTITANPTSVTSGGSVSLTWSSTNATSCTASNAWTGTKATNGSQSLTNLTTNGTYTLACTGAGGSVTKSATITVTAAADTTPPTVTITGPISSLGAGTTQTTLTATSNEAASCRYSTNSAATYATMTAFTTTGAMAHSTALTGLANGTSYTYYVKCQDAALNTSNNATVAFAVAASAPTTPPPAAGWVNTSFAAQSGTFTANFDATPSQNNADVVIGLSSGIAAGYNDLAVTPRFNPAGTIDARDGGAYAFGVSIPYTANTAYHFRLVVSVPTHTYSVYVTPAGQSEILLASNYSFRTGQTSVSSLANYAVYGLVGNATVTNFSIASTPAPTVSLSANPTSITSGQSATLSWSSANTTSCTGTGFTASGTSGSATVSPTTNTTYTLSCSGAGGSASQSTTIAVSVVTPPTGDTTAPSVPTGLTATAASASQINLSWTASTDNVGVTGYQVFRNGTQVGTPNTNAYSDGGLSASTAYSYTVKAVDAAGNISAVSGAASATTQAVVVTPPPTGNCNLNATTANFAAQVTAATAGQVICLATGNYGTWTGTNKAITITKQAGATPTMNVDFNTGDSGFTLDGIGGMGGTIVNGANNITIKNSSFTSALAFDNLANSNILLDRNTHNNIDINSTCTGEPGRIHLAWGSNVPSGVTIQNSIFDGGNTDGIQAGTGLNIINNVFRNIREKSASDCAHSDSIQLIGAQGTVVRGNYFYNNADGIVAYDGISSATIEDNVIDLVSGRWGIELYSDKNSIVRHNTLVYRTTCEYSPCGHIIIDHKSTDPAGTGTQIYDNVAYSIDVNSGSSASRNDHNMLIAGASGTNFSGTPIYVGGINSTTYAGFALAAGSPGKGAASDGLDVGIRVSGGSTPPPAAPTVSLTASPTSITSGNSSTLIWSSTNATSCTASGGWSGTKATAGTGPVSPTANTTYTLTCSGAGGSATQSTTVTVTPPAGDTTAPSVPTGLTATAASASQINLSWTASTDNVGVTGYQVFRNGTQVGTPITTLYSDIGLTAATTYSYTVKARDAAANISAASTAASATTLPLTASFAVGDRMVTTANLNVRGTASPTGTLLGTQPLGSLGTLVGGPTIAGGFIWWNINYDTGVDGWSAQDFIAKTTPLPTVSISASPTAITSGQSTTLSWTSTNATSCTASNGWTGAKATSGTTSVSPTATVTYTLACTGSGGSATQSTTVTVNAAPDTTAPSAPTNLTATAASASQINLSWTASTDNVGVTGYKVFRGGTQIASLAGTNYSDSGLSASTAYSYTVSAYDAAGNTSGNSTAASATTQGVVTPPPTSGLKGWQLTTTNIGLAPYGLSCATLPAYTGSLKPAAGARISNVRITGNMDLSNGDIVITKSCFQPTSGDDRALVSNDVCGATECVVQSAQSVTITDSEFDASIAPASSIGQACAFRGVGTLQRNYMHGMGSGICFFGTGLTFNALAEQNYVTGLRSYGGSHNEAATIRDFRQNGSNTRTAQFLNNRLDCQSGNETGGLFIQPTWVDIFNVWVQGNYIEGGGYNLYLNKITSGGNYGNINATDNRFRSTGWGPTTVDGGNGFDTWSQNYLFNASATNAMGTAVSCPGGACAGSATPPPASTKFIINDRVQVSSGPLNVRATANAAGTLLGTQATNALGTVTGGPTAQGGFNWWNINFDTGVDGWSAEDFLVKYTAPTPAPTVSLTASPTSITSGGSANLIWSSTNATSCTASNGWTGTKATSGTTPVSPTTNTTYTLTCTGAGGSATQSTTITVSVVTPPTGNCNLNATTANFAAQVTAATAGQVICLATGNYGTWTGTNKAITITKQAGATPTMNVDFNTGDSGFTLDGIGGMGGSIVNGANNITIKNSAFTSSLVIDGVANANILLDNNTHININSCTTCTPAAVHLSYSGSTLSGVTIQNSLFQGGNADGIQAGTGLNIINNRFIDISEHGNNALHTDAIQLLGAKGTVVRGNYLYNTSDGVVAYDGVDSATIEDNVIDLVNGRWGIELYSDKNSIVRHNTLVYRSSCGSSFCGDIALDHKSADPAGTGTVIENNIAAELSFSNGSTATVNRNNMVRTGASGTNFTGAAVYTGGASATTYAGFALAAGSPGKGVASDGLDVGIRVSGAPPPSTPAPTVSLTASPTSITSGSSATLSWSSTNATSCSGSGFSASGTSGSATVAPTSNTSYTLTCTGTGGSASQSTTITVSTGSTPDTTAPSAPANLTAAAASASQINLSWSASTDNVGVISYQVFRGGTLVSSPTATSFSDTGLAASTAYSYTIKAVDAGGNISAVSNIASATTQAAAGGGGTTLTLGYTTIGGTTDSSDSNFMNATRFTTGATGGTAQSMSVYVASPIGAAPNNQYSMAIYSDASGAPGSLVASTGNGTLTGNAWNTLTITATLAANTTYWLAYNTNGTAGTQNNFKEGAGSAGQVQWRAQTFGSWPASFGATAGNSANAMSIYVTYSGVAINNQNTSQLAGAAAALNNLSVGAKIRTTSNLNVRSTPNGALLGTEPAGTTGAITNGPQTAGGYTWWLVQYADGKVGWSVENYLAR